MISPLFRSLTIRLAIAYAGLFSLSLILLLAGYYVFAIHLPLQRTRAQVERESAALVQIYRRYGDPALVDALRTRTIRQDDIRPFHAYFDRQGRLITANIPSWPKISSGGWLRLEADPYVDGGEIDYEALALDRRLDDGARLIVGRDIGNISERERETASGAFIMLGVGVILSLLGGWLMSRAIGRRIDRVVLTAHNVMAGDLSDRIAVDGSGDEFDRLAHTLNLMLERIDESMDAVRRVSDSVAHELRTPLTRLRASLEAALDDPAPGGASLAEALGEAERLGGIFDAVLRISRIETGGYDNRMADADLTALLEDVADFYRPEAEDRGHILSTFIQTGLRLHCDKDLLFQAVANLIDNGIKYTPRGGEIVLSGRGEGDAIIIGIRDTGPGVPQHDLPKITERFFRSGQSDGQGLGLSLVDAIARLHRSRLHLANLPTGFRIEWIFTRAPKS